DGRLALDHDFRSRRFQQPARERVLSTARARCREQLEQASFAEQIEVFGIRVRRIAEAFARLAGTGPAVLDSSDATVVISRRALGAFPVANHALVINDERNKCRSGNSKPPATERVPAERGPREPGGGEEQNQPGVADLDVTPLLAIGPGAARG